MCRCKKCPTLEGYLWVYLAKLTTIARKQKSQQIEKVLLRMAVLQLIFHMRVKGDVRASRKPISDTEIATSGLSLPGPHAGLPELVRVRMWPLFHPQLSRPSVSNYSGAVSTLSPGLVFGSRLFWKIYLGYKHRAVVECLAPAHPHQPGWTSGWKQTD